MLFNSFHFILFFCIFFTLYYSFSGKGNFQKWLLLLSSYFFYGYASLKMIPLLFFSTVFFFFLAKLLHKKTNSNYSRTLVSIGVTTGLGVLFYYKYFGFFITSASSLLNSLGIMKPEWRSFDIIMPLGISFFTFKLISYLIDVNRGKIEPSSDFVGFATYISFFPTILAGPIDRPHTFLPQLRPHPFNPKLITDGCRQILWGAFQKIAIADNLASYTAYAWDNIETSNGSTLFLAAILFTLQMYTDFSGYSDMAIGIGKVLGFNLTKNFNYPFFATNVAEFWKRWHMSLTSWLTEYIFMPLNISFRNLGNLGMILAIIINMVFVGAWHGANWTFVVFGLYHGLLFIPLVLAGRFLKKEKIKPGKYGIPVFKDLIRMIGTFMLVTTGLIVFNSDSIEQSLNFYKGLFSFSIFTWPYFNHSFIPVAFTAILCSVFIILEWNNRKKEYAIQDILQGRQTLRWALYIFLIGFILLFKVSNQEYIYMQF